MVGASQGKAITHQQPLTPVALSAVARWCTHARTHRVGHAIVEALEQAPLVANPDGGREGLFHGRLHELHALLLREAAKSDVGVLQELAQGEGAVDQHEAARVDALKIEHVGYLRGEVAQVGGWGVRARSPGARGRVVRIWGNKGVEWARLRGRAWATDALHAAQRERQHARERARCSP